MKALELFNNRTSSGYIAKAIAQIRLKGFSIEIVERYLIKVSPIENLTASQQQFILDHYEAIADFLYSESLENQNIRKY